MTQYQSIIYQDAGQELQQSLRLVHSLLRRDGYVFVIQQEKSLPRLVHPTMFRSLNVDPRLVCLSLCVCVCVCVYIIGCVCVCVCVYTSCSGALYTEPRIESLGMHQVLQNRDGYD